jgi:hypothetical protein
VPRPPGREAALAWLERRGVRSDMFGGGRRGCEGRGRRKRSEGARYRNASAGAQRGAAPTGRPSLRFSLGWRAARETRSGRWAAAAAPPRGLPSLCLCAGSAR